jgi:hypothetical protein
VTRSNYAGVVAAPDRFRGAPVTIAGKVFTKPERGPDGEGFQMFAAPDGEWNTVVFAAPNVIPATVEQDTYVLVEGAVLGEFAGENSFGGTVDAVQIVASRVTIVDALALLGDPTASVVANHALDQHGLTVTVDRVDAYPDRVLVRLTVVNASDSRASVFTYSMKIVQAGGQYAVEPDFELPALDADIVAGATVTGIARFPLFDVSQPFQVVIEGRTEDYGLEFTEYTFDVG